MRARTRPAVLTLVAGLLVAAPLTLTSAWAQAPNRDIDSYVLFAYDELTWKGGTLATNSGFINGGNIGVNYPLSDAPSNPTGFSLNFGTSARGIMSPGSQVVADSVRADDNQDIIYYLFANTLNPSFGGAVMNPNPATPKGNYPFTTPIIATADLPTLPFTPNRALTNNAGDLTVGGAGGQPSPYAVSPGPYRDVRFNDGVVVNFGDGTYDMRSLSIGKNVRVNVTDKTIWQIDRNWSMNDYLALGLGTNAGARIYIGAYGVNVNSTRVSTFAHNVEIHAQVFAPTGWIDLGGGSTLYGRFWAQRITGDPNNNVYYVPPPSEDANPSIAVEKSVSLDCGETWDDADEAPGPTVDLTNVPGEINRNPGTYVLLALDSLAFKGGNEGTGTRGYVLGGNVGVNSRDPKLYDNTIQLNVGANGLFVMSDGTQLVGGSIRLGVEASVWDVYVAAESGTGWGATNPKLGGDTIRNEDHMISNDTDLPIIPLNELTTSALCGPFAAAGTTDITVTTGSGGNSPLTLAPGAYRDIQVQNGAILYLGAGTYTVRRFNTGQNVDVFTVPGTVIHVWGDNDPNAQDFNLGGNGSYFGSAIPGVESVARVCVSDVYANNHVQFSDNGTFWGEVLAPNASVNLGRNFTHYGRFVGRTIGSDFNDNVTYRTSHTDSCPPDIVRFRFVVMNTGDVQLTNITLTDNVIVLDPSACAVPFSLAPDDHQAGGPDQFECTITAAAVPGQHSNTATASGVYGGQTYTAQDDAHYFGN